MDQRMGIVQKYTVWLIDNICIVISYMIATYMRFGGERRMEFGDKSLHFMVLVVFILFCAIYSYMRDWNRNILSRGYYNELTKVIKMNLIMVGASLILCFFFRWSYILSRQVIIVFLILNTLLTLLSHCAFKKVMRTLYANDYLVTKILTIAQKGTLDNSMETFKKKASMNYQIVGGISVDEESDFRAIIESVTQIAFDEVFIDAPGIAQSFLHPLIRSFMDMGVVCHYYLAMPDMDGISCGVGQVGKLSTLTYSVLKMSQKKLLIKRLIDIVGGLVGIILTGIITIFLAPAIKLDSPGPVFFSQTRVGKNGRRFKIYKFRSMYRDAEARLKDLEAQNEVKGLMFKMENDPRITKVGAFIRKTSLDEFPQFLNVLKGDMSLVGTRPPTEKEFEQYNEHYRRRLSLTPGLTGMWQVSGRSNINDFDEVVRLDLQYIDNWSLSLDFKIILQTVGVVLFGRGAK